MSDVIYCKSKSIPCQSAKNLQPSIEISESFVDPDVSSPGKSRATTCFAPNPRRRVHRQRIIRAALHCQNTIASPDARPSFWRNCSKVATYVRRTWNSFDLGRVLSSAAIQTWRSTVRINYTIIMLMFLRGYGKIGCSPERFSQIRYSIHIFTHERKGLRESCNVDHGEPGRSLCSNRHYCLPSRMERKREREREREGGELRVIVCFSCVGHLILDVSCQLDHGSILQHFSVFWVKTSLIFKHFLEMVTFSQFYGLQFSEYQSTRYVIATIDVENIKFI